MAKWVFYVLVFVYMCYRAVYGGRIIDSGITVETINYDEEDYLEVGSRKTVTCKAPNKNHRLDWIDPSGNVVKRIPSSRVYAQEHFTPSPKGIRTPSLTLTFADLQVSDTGLYQCRSGEQKKSVRVCVIKPAEFVDIEDTPAEITIEAGRAITLSCQATGDPEPSIEWTRNDVILTEEEGESKYKINKRYKIDGYESLLTITSVGPDDGGLYNCVAVQESAMLENCSVTSSKNVTLLVNHVPLFEGDDKVEYVYGKANEVVDITCEAQGYPKPTYRFFKDLGGGSLYEFDKSKIIFSEDPNTATLPVTAGPTSYGNTYKCTASNVFGDTDKTFKLRRREKPAKADKVSPVVIGSNKVVLNVSWDEPIYFPVDEIRIDYYSEEDEKHKHMVKKNDEFEISESDIYIALADLEPETKYFIRLRAENAAGVSPWADEIRFSTADKDQSEKILEGGEDEEETEDKEDQKVESDGSETTMFYGIFFTVGIMVIAVICMFAMRMV